ncbi:DUF1499 domain-containing protein [Pseudodesulfovibrio indicus]|uniref:DUF1499 domain-containing protein n=1 Tax=Pseudodesulfovibrio indicus TaxID=1716143 RepID=UPI00292FD16C|nr:DUF1499 domain-containing protein [Pseudodesulfovibrio indicus]
MKKTLPLILSVAALFALIACSSKVPDMGMQQGRFALCQEGADCVSSQATNEKHRIEPFQARGDANKVMVDLGNAVESIFGGKVLETEGNYLRAEFKSSILRTVDDAEFYYDEQAGVIEVHAVSRGETLDFSDNRDRMEELRVIFASMQ